MYKYNTIPLTSPKLPQSIENLYPLLSNVIIVKNGHIIVKNIPDFDEEIIIDTHDKLQPNHLNMFLTYGYVNTNQFNDEKYEQAIKKVNSSLFIYLPRRKFFESKLHIIYVFDENNISHDSRIILEESSKIDVFEYIFTENTKNMNFISSTIIKQNSLLSYSAITNFDEDTNGVIRRNSYVYQDASSVFTLAQLSNGNIDEKTNSFLKGEYANSAIKTVAFTTDKQYFKIHQLIVHEAKKTTGLIENYGVSNGESHLIFEGTGKIEKNMKQSKARQSNRGIVLGKHAKLEANPLLLIDEFDVEAGHGAAIGKIDDEQLYYLMSRGLPLEMAERLIISGFLSPMLKQLDNDVLKNIFMKQVESKTL